MEEETLIGIDIGSYYVKVCKIFKKNGKEISACSLLQNVYNMEYKQKQMVLKNLLDKINSGKDSVFLAFGGRDIINRDVVLSKDRARSKDFETFVLEEIKNSVNEDLNSYHKACAIIRDFSDKELCVMFSAVPKQKIKDVISLVEGCSNLQVVGITMETLALTNSFVEFGPEYSKNENIALLNIGSKLTNIVFLNKGKVVFVKDFNWGGQDVTRGISNVYSIPEKLAEEIKKRTDLREKINFNMRNILKSSAVPLIDVLFGTIEYCITRHLVPVIDRIFITGGASLTYGLDSFIEETIGINTEKWNPLENKNIVGYSHKDYGQFCSVVMGLALEKKEENFV